MIQYDLNLNSESAGFIKTDSNHLVIVFSAINIPKGKFGFSRFFDNTNENKLFVNSPGNQWFQRDIDGINKLIDIVVKENAIQKVFYYGASMGAYAALLFAQLRSDGPCLSYGPNIHLGIQGSHSSRYGICFDDRYKDLSRLHSQSTHPINIWFGAYDLVDTYYYHQLKSSPFFQGSNFKVRLVESCHAFHQHFIKLVFADQIRDDFLSAKGSIEPPLLYPHLDESTLSAKVQNYKSWADFLSDKPVDVSTITINDIGDSFCRARILQKHGDHKSAINTISDAISHLESSRTKQALPKDYLSKFYFLRAESKRRTKDSTAESDYGICFNNGFKKNLVSRFLSSPT